MRILILLLLMVVAGAGALAWDYQRFLDTPANVAENKVFTVPSGASLRRVGQDLAEAGIIENAHYWEAYGRMEGQAQSLRAGEYLLTPDLTPPALLALFVQGRTLQYSLTIPEGWNFRQMMRAIAAHEHIENTLEPDDYDSVMERLGKPDAHPEGWFFPDTYLFPRGTTDMDFLRRAHERMERALASSWEARQEDLPLESPYEALILASIVEKETGRAAERPMVAAVFVERLRRGMRLQTDPTVIYGIEHFDGRIRRRDLRLDTPYNTYTRDGLPPTPIALPGAAALEAVANPADSRALFFVSRGDGSHHFSETYREHRQAVIKYQLGGDASRYGR
ncbi:aminodeoxychorismate lyase [Ectothiorhodospira haloalkaliphila]|uniref:Endolytic murein transglycosylase n=1 Tax=Ectothiorhodospira haloalkaliphila TaxID=421628 RepID=W8L5U7_9GAMM|nr:endolytic transglycosylase MltG [Ectothiorhodospira haloalkaliphila]AHK79255.1 aminodeoxychorismate lyase [Ectothiorhodospira haloalkaliphila]